MPALKFHLTHSLLYSWQWSYKLENGQEQFIKALNRVKEPPTPAMRNGVAFESAVNNYLDGASLEGLSDPARKWVQGIRSTADFLWGARQQVVLGRDITVDGVCFRLMGVLDFLKAGVIYDTKFSQHYSLNKYLDSTQHPMYFYLCPEATEFQYLSCDGKFVYREIYHPEDTRPVEGIIRNFMTDLDRQGLIDLYAEKWNLETVFQKRRSC